MGNASVNLFFQGKTFWDHSYLSDIYVNNPDASFAVKKTNQEEKTQRLYTKELKQALSTLELSPGQLGSCTFTARVITMKQGETTGTAHDFTLSKNGDFTAGKLHRLIISRTADGQFNGQVECLDHQRSTPSSEVNHDALKAFLDSLTSSPKTPRRHTAATLPTSAPKKDFWEEAASYKPLEHNYEKSKYSALDILLAKLRTETLALGARSTLDGLSTKMGSIEEQITKLDHQLSKLDNANQQVVSAKLKYQKDLKTLERLFLDKEQREIEAMAEIDRTLSEALLADIEQELDDLNSEMETLKRAIRLTYSTDNASRRADKETKLKQAHTRSMQLRFAIDKKQQKADGNPVIRIDSSSSD